MIQALPESWKRGQRDREAWLEMREQSRIRRARERNTDAAPLTQVQQPHRQLTGSGIQPHASLFAVYQGLTIHHAGAGRKGWICHGVRGKKDLPCKGVNKNLSEDANCSSAED